MLFIRPDSAVQTEAESLRGDSFFFYGYDDVNAFLIVLELKP